MDINRNWDYHHGESIQLKEEYCGKTPKSEPEVKFLDHVAKSFKPKVYLTLHSGIFGLYHPYGFKEKLNFQKKLSRLESSEQYKSLSKLLTDIKSLFCSSCDLGMPFKLIGYNSSGTSMDYMYEKLKIPISMTWELYTNERVFQELEEYKRMKKEFRFVSTENLRRRPPSYESLDEIPDNLSECFSLFNPKTPSDLEFTIRNWISAFQYFLNNIQIDK